MIFARHYKHNLRSILLILFFGLAFVSCSNNETMEDTLMPVATITTSVGEIHLELNAETAPITVKNFIDLANAGYYEGTIFHRIIDGFMIQGGGFDQGMVQKSTYDAIKNEASSDLANSRGTLAMARTSVVDSATSQFFINLVDNDFLNHVDESPRGFGYAVFGRVIDGMDVVDVIAKVATGTVRGYADVPNEAVVINSVRRRQ